ncbi:MAG: bifunctional UDP-N-acetylglucosamine diphosphorylase/glucosamine-1-phosphate N-acetyltransferase GlmU [Erysipelotrichaceae bacterium]|nr:bifunctional UDP-N-acetylglucosamine diphosphorylase/glucosamine-1-phosphate N-acetyltransferase GlmU [Erysipelotrichaceae bacterium]
MTSAIVMAAGKGTRMHSRHGKTMHKLLDRPIIEHICDTLEKLEIENRVFVVGFDGDSIREHLKDRCDYAVQDPQQGTAHAVMQAVQLKDKTGKTLIINGDCPLISEETYRKLLDTADQYPLVVLTTVPEDPASYGRIIRNENGDVEAIVEKKDCNEEQLKVREINAGIYCVDNELLWKYLPEVNNDNAQKEYYVTDLVAIFRRHGHKVGALIGDCEELQGINSHQELARAGKWLQRKINNYWMDRGVAFIDPDSVFIGPDVQIGQDTIIYPNVRMEGKTVVGMDNSIQDNCVFINAVIGNNNMINACRITDSQVGDDNKIGPSSHLRNGCQIGSNCRIGNYVEMKNTVFGDGSKCTHLTYVGDATVGKKCNFGCGVVTVNYDGVHKFHTTIGDNCFIGSNVNIIAPVTVHDNTVLAAGSTITRDVLEGEMAIGRVRQENKPEYGFKYLKKDK